MKSQVILITWILALASYGGELVAVKTKSGSKQIYEYASIFYLNLASFPTTGEAKEKLTNEQYEAAWRAEQNQALFFAFMIHLDRLNSVQELLSDDLSKVYKKRTSLLLKSADWNSFLKYVNSAGKSALEDRKAYFENYEITSLNQDIEKFRAEFIGN